MQKNSSTWIYSWPHGPRFLLPTSKKMGTHGLGDFLPPWSPLLPSQAKQTHVYTLKSTHIHITLVLGKATDIQCLSSLRKHHHQVNAPKLLTRSTEGKRRRENVVTIWDWIQTCTFFMSGFLLNTKNGACETVPAYRSWHETLLTKSWGKRIPAFFCSVNLRQTFKKHLIEYPKSGLLKGNQTSVT